MEFLISIARRLLAPKNQPGVEHHAPREYYPDTSDRPTAASWILHSR